MRPIEPQLRWECAYIWECVSTTKRTEKEGIYTKRQEHERRNRHSSELHVTNPPLKICFLAKYDHYFSS